MGAYRYIPEEQKQLVLTMCLRGMKVNDIVEATGMGRTTILRIKRNWRSTGRVIRKSMALLKSSGPRLFILSLLGHWCQGQPQEDWL
ncbi:hypothetical protein BYT27DRAFT_7248012 [Phlegmacium glaucopus]|nr:hypothetical protein BYT27DRAFT_7248012 [Phlegmacium glaucopus]